MMAAEIKGCSMVAFISRFPIEVRVLSSTHNREPRFSRLRMVSVSSRFFRAVRSRRIYWASLYSFTVWIRSIPVR